MIHHRKAVGSQGFPVGLVYSCHIPVKLPKVTIMTTGSLDAAPPEPRQPPTDHHAAYDTRSTGQRDADLPPQEPYPFGWP